MITRRQLLLGATASWLAPAWADPRADARASSPRLFAAWDTAQGSRIGVLARGDANTECARIETALDVPTRAHGIAVEAAGSVLVVARRPGDWMLRVGFSRAGTAMAQAWCWVEPQRAFNGHALASADGRLVYTTETDLDDGQGLIGVRDASTLEKIAEWSTHGRDPHELILDATTQPASLLIANGGIPTQPETGRAKQRLDRMDSSLIRLNANDGELLEQWRAEDPRLSLRHVARRGNTIAVALQAEHDDPARRVAAPVLGLTDARMFRVMNAPRTLQGYGGDIAATREGFAVSCPRAGGVARFSSSGEWRGFVPLPNACALADDDRALWVGGGNRMLRLVPGPGPAANAATVGATVRLDNHWAPLSARPSPTACGKPRPA